MRKRAMTRINQPSDVLADGLIVEPGGSHEVQVTLGADGGKVDGAVIDSAGHPNSGATVLLVPNASLRHRADPDQNNGKGQQNDRQPQRSEELCGAIKEHWRTLQFE